MSDVSGLVKYGLQRSAKVCSIIWIISLALFTNNKLDRNHPWQLSSANITLIRSSRIRSLVSFT